MALRPKGWAVLVLVFLFLLALVLANLVGGALAGAFREWAPTP
jgi:hypothetical protein